MTVRAACYSGSLTGASTSVSGSGRVVFQVHIEFCVSATGILVVMVDKKTLSVKASSCGHLRK